MRRWAEAPWIGVNGAPNATAVDAKGIPIGSVIAPANRRDSPLLVPALQHASDSVGALPDGASVHLDRGYDSESTRGRLEDRGLKAEISEKGKPAPLAATNRWVVERTSSWHNAHKKLVWRTERQGEVIATSGWPSSRWSS